MPDKDLPNVSLDAVYAQMYAEMRGYRDHEFRVAAWFTTILLAFLAAVVAGKYAAAGSPLGVALERCPSLKGFLAALPVLVGIYGAWSMADAMRRYAQLRKWVSDTLEPENGLATPAACCPSLLRPGTLMCAVQVFLGIFIAILIVHRPSVLDG